MGLGLGLGEAVEPRLDCISEAVLGRGRPLDGEEACLLEGEEACKEREEAHAERPDVGGEGVVRLRSAHLGRAVRLAARKLVQ